MPLTCSKTLLGRLAVFDEEEAAAAAAVVVIDEEGEEEEGFVLDDVAALLEFVELETGSKANEN